MGAALENATREEIVGTGVNAQSTVGHIAIVLPVLLSHQRLIGGSGISPDPRPDGVG